MSTFPVEPPVTPPASSPEAPSARRRELSQEELATLPLQALLVRAGYVTLDQLADALRENVATGRAVEDIALSRGWISAEHLAALRAAKASYPAGAPAPIAEAPAAPAPFVPAPAAPAPVAYVPAAPAPVVEAPAPRAPAAADTSVGVFLNLEDGARIWAGRFDSLEAAEQHAHDLTESLVRPEPGVWPRFGDQLVRPDAVVSVEVSPRENP